MRASVINRFAKNITVAQDTVWTRRGRRLALAVPLAAVAAVGLVGCNNPHQGVNAAPSVQPSASATAAATPSVSPTFSATPTAPAAAPSAPATKVAPTTQAAPVKAKLNGTAHTNLTISNGTRYVVMDGKLVDFGTPVRDLSWSPDGGKAAFVDGSGDLVVSNPDGSGKVVVAKNPGGQTWSHPTWQVTATPEYVLEQTKSIVIFTAAQAGSSRLEWVPSTAANGTPQQLGLSNYPEAAALPQTGNLWPNAGGIQGRSVYANADNGDVYIRDDYLRQQGGVLTKGSEPALSSLDEVAFVRSVDGHDHIFSDDLRTGTVKDLTPHATVDYTEPAFSQDGVMIAARTPEGIATFPADGTVAPTHISDYTGLPAYRRL